MSDQGSPVGREDAPSSMVPRKDLNRRGYVINYLGRYFGGFYGETPEEALESCRTANPNLRGGPEAFTVAGEEIA